MRRFFRPNLKARLDWFVQVRLRGWVYLKHGEPPVSRMRNALVTALYRDIYELVRRDKQASQGDYRGYTLRPEHDTQPQVAPAPGETDRIINQIMAELDALDTPVTLKVLKRGAPATHTA